MSAMLKEPTRGESVFQSDPDSAKNPDRLLLQAKKIK